MSLHIGEIMNLEEFKEYRFLGGKKGMDNEITSVTVLDEPNILPSLSGGELVLSTGYVIQQGVEDMSQLIRGLSAAGCAALFVQTEKYLGPLPPEVIQTANELAFPIVNMPLTATLKEVISPITKRLVDIQTSSIRLSENINTSFINAVINGGGISEIINTIATLLNCNIAFYDAVFNKIYPSKNTSLKEGFSDCFQDEYPNIPICVDEKQYGFLVIVNEDHGAFSKYEEMILGHAATALKLIGQKYLSNMEIEARYRDGFVQDIVLNNIKSLQEVIKRGKIYGWDLSDRWYTTVVVDIDDFKIQYLNIHSKKDSESIEKTNDEIFDFSLKFLRKHFKNVLYTKFTDSAAYIIKHDKPTEETTARMRKVCNELRQEVNRLYHFTITIGVGESKSSIMDCHASYQEAQKSIKISRLIYKRDNVMVYTSLGIYKFLDGIKENPSVREFYKDYIDKICRHDEQHNTDFMETLINIVQNGWNLKMASDSMYLHYNTIKYRYKKIEEIAGLDLDKTEEKLSMELAVKIYLMNHM